MMPKVPTLQAVKSAVKWHFNTVKQERTPAQEERDTLFFGRPFNRWFMVPAVVLIQACVGSYFAWTVYNVPIERELGVPEGSSAITFFITMALVGVSGSTCGPFVDRKGPRISLQVSGSIIYLGHLVAALGVYVKSLSLVYVGYGMLVGLGTGVAFLCPISPLLKWFPDKRGLMSMVGVAGFSMGTMMFSLAEGALIPVIGVTWTLVLLGSASFLVYLGGSMVLRTPPVTYKPKMFITQAVVSAARVSQSSKEQKTEPAKQLDESTHADDVPVNASNQIVDVRDSAAQTVSYASLAQLEAGKNDSTAAATARVDVQTQAQAQAQVEWTLLECLSTHQYWCMYFVFIAVCVPTFLTSAKLADMCELQFGTSQQVASIVTAAFAGVSLAGRLFFGAVSDRCGRRNLYLLSLVMQGVCLVALPFLFTEQLFGGFVAVMMIMAALNIGPTLAAAFLADLFGPKNVAGLYGFLLTAAPSFVGVIGGTVFSSVYKMQANVHGPTAPEVYNINFYWMAALAFLGFFVTLLIRKPIKKTTTLAAC